MSLLTTTNQLWGQGNRAAYVEQPDTFWPIKFMCRETHQIDIERFDIQRQQTRYLYRVQMESDAPFLEFRANFGNWIDRPDFIIGINDAHQNGIISQRIHN